MKRLIFTKVMAILCMLFMWVAKGAADDAATITVKAPTITPASCEYNGTIMPVITAEDGCSIVYVKSTSKLYTTVEDIDSNKGVKTEDSNQASITDIVGKTGNRYISAYAVKDVGGIKYKSDVSNVTYTYNPNAATKKNLTLSGSSIALDMANPSKTATISVSAKDTDGNAVTGLKYRYEVYPENIVTIDANGVVKPEQAGTASITVIFDGNDTYNAATCVIDVNVASNATSTDKVFYSIADIRHATQPADDYDWTDKTRNDIIKNKQCALIFTQKNPATVVAVMQKEDEKLKKKTVNSFFIIDNSNRGLWILDNDYINPTKDKLKVGTKITGTFLGNYNEGEKGIPSITDTKATLTINGTKYTMSFEFDHSEEGTEEVPATYPYTEVPDVNTIAKYNESNGSIVKASYGVYLNSIVKVPGVIKLGAGGVYYLMQDESYDAASGNDNYRLPINTDQLSVNLADYVNTSGVFEGILIKHTDDKAKLVVLKDNFFQINKIYLDENDAENRIDDLVNAGAFDDEVDVYVHRTKLVNSNSEMWNTICLPFDLTAEEFKKAFGCEISALAVPKVTGEETIDGRLTKIGDTDATGNLLFDIQNDLTIKEGMPYLIKAKGTQTACAKTDVSYANKTPQDLMYEDPTYYAAIGQKLITVVPPHQIRGTFNNKIVGGNFYFRGLYGGKTYIDGSTENVISDNGSQKYQYISTTDNYLKYLASGSSAKFPGLRAYFYFPNWNAAENNKYQGTTTSTNSKVHLLVDYNNATGISNIESSTEPTNARVYNLAGQQVDSSYKGIVIKNGRKYIVK